MLHALENAIMSTVTWSREEGLANIANYWAVFIVLVVAIVAMTVTRLWMQPREVSMATSAGRHYKAAYVSLPLFVTNIVAIIVLYLWLTPIGVMNISLVEYPISTWSSESLLLDISNFWIVTVALAVLSVGTAVLMLRTDGTFVGPAEFIGEHDWMKQRKLRFLMTVCIVSTMTVVLWVLIVGAINLIGV